MKLIYSTNNTYKAEIIKCMLEENNIKTVLLNKQDSSYNMFGMVEIFVSDDQEEIAKELIYKNYNERNN